MIDINDLNWEIGNIGLQSILEVQSHKTIITTPLANIKFRLILFQNNKNNNDIDIIRKSNWINWQLISDERKQICNCFYQRTNLLPLVWKL